MSATLLSGLNPQQLEAVTLPHQSALILAGAGSGKTRVLTTRIAYLIQTGQASPHGLLAVTFTNKAAKEMLARISALLPINTRGMWIGTFHGLCNRLLRAHHREAGLPQLFQILDSADQLSLIKRVMKTLNVDDEKYPSKQAQWFIAGNKEAGLRSARVEAFDDFSRRMNEIYAAYEEQCQREGAVDFAELLLRSFELLSRNEILREHYRSRFAHILVDEFQDTNRLQYDWLKLLAGTQPAGANSFAQGRINSALQDAPVAMGAGNAVFAVGDDDQSIYAFRGADAANMRDFERDFGSPRIIKLEQNYRSHGNILDAANALIRHNRGRLGKNLWTSEGGGEPLRVYEAASDFEEAGFVVDEIRSLKSEGAALSGIALLYRSNAQSRVLEHALFSAGLPYRVYGGLRFFERQEIKHALAYLRLLASGDDDGALLRVVNFPTRGIGSRSLEQLQESARQRGTSLWAAACAGALSGKAGASIADFVRLVEAMRRACENLPLPEAVGHVIAHSGLAQHYKNEKEGAERLENLDELVNAASAFIAEEREDASLAGFLAHAALEAGEHQAADGSDALQLMTAHSAKGLEFHSVFISGLEEGLFPHENSLNEDGGVEEERRLMYVALTRARRRLYLSFAQSRMLHGQTRYNVKSRFFGEIPANLLKWINDGSGLRPRDSGPTLQSIKPRTWNTGFGTQHPALRAQDPAPSTPCSPWRIGQNVLHPKFGAGVIVSAEGHGADARVQVNFRGAGVKWLALAYAKLAAA